MVSVEPLPIFRLPIANCRLPIDVFQESKKQRDGPVIEPLVKLRSSPTPSIGNWQLAIGNVFIRTAEL